MFTGIIESIGIIEDIISEGGNKTFWISSPLSQEFKVDQSISHNGICLTIEEIKDKSHCITAIEETIAKTTISKWQKGHTINLERSMMANGRFDGHIVQGHVDCIAECIAVTQKEGSWEYSFEFPAAYTSLIIEKGSVAVNGISLTCFNTSTDRFSVAIIPYTYQHTTIKILQKGELVNVEFDMIGKYVNRVMALR